MRTPLAGHVAGTAPAASAGRCRAASRGSGCPARSIAPLATARSSGEAGAQLAVEDPVLEASRRRGSSPAATVSRCSLPVRNCAGAHWPCDAVAAAVDAERQPRRRPAREVERGRAAPARPAAVAADRQIDRALACRSAPAPARSPARSTRAPTSNLLRSGSASRWKATPVAAIVHRPRQARPARGPNARRPCRARVPLRASPPTCGPIVEPVDRAARRRGCRSREGSALASCSA